MAKLYFKYGAMGSSKSAQALTTKFNYEEKGMTVWLIKPGTDTRDGADIIRSRIGSEHAAVPSELGLHEGLQRRHHIHEHVGEEHHQRHKDKDSPPRQR